MRFFPLCALLFGLLTAVPAQAQEPGDLVLTEWLVNPANPITDSSGEWFELFNTTDRPIDLQGWAVRDSAASGLRPLHLIATSVVVPSRGFVVLGNNTNTTVNGGVPVDYSYGGALAFANSLDGLVLLAPDSSVVDRSYFTSAAISAQDGISRELLNTAFSNVNADDVDTWTSALATAVYGPGGRGTPKAAGQTVLAPRPTSASASSVTSAVAGYRLLSPPVAGLTVGTLAGLNLVQGVSDEFPDGGANLFTGYTGNGAGPNGGYTVPTSKSAYLVQGRGFFWYMYAEGGPGPGATAGTSRRADLPLTLQADGYLRTAAVRTSVRKADRAGATDQFYLLGNPFNAEFDLSGLTTSSGTLSNVFQFYEPTTGFTVRTRVAGTEDGDPADDAAVWEGFFAEFSVAPTFPFTFTYAAPAPAPLAGQAAVASRHVGLVLDGVTAAGVAAHDEAASLYFTAEATEMWDAYDASKRTPPAATAALLAPVGPGPDGVTRALAQMSLPHDLVAPVTVPLALTAAAGTYTISAATFDGVPSSWAVTLTDHATGAVTPLGAGTSYAFETPVVSASDRFSVTVLPGRTTETEPGLGSAFVLAAVSPNPSVAVSRTTLQVGRSQTVRAEVYDVLGRRAQTVFAGLVSAGSAQSLEVSTDMLPAGTYVLRVTGADFTATRTFSVAR